MIVTYETLAYSFIPFLMRDIHTYGLQNKEKRKQFGPFVATAVAR